MIEIVEAPIDKSRVAASVLTPETGAVVTFDGTVRNNARGKKVTHLYYDAYPEMASRELEKIRLRALQSWSLEEVSVVHRIGRMEIGESSVFIAVSAAHRQQAFQACQFVIDTLKTSVPIWKKEFYEDGESWIEGYGGQS